MVSFAIVDRRTRTAIEGGTKNRPGELPRQSIYFGRDDQKWEIIRLP